MIHANYLMFFNLFQFSFFFSSIPLILSRPFNQSYKFAGLLFQVVLSTSFLEVFHAAFGLVNAGALVTFLQVCARLLFFFVVYIVDEIQTSPLVFCVFLAWSLIEIIRYPFYALCLMNQNTKLFKTMSYFRYTLWIPLYPIGVIGEWSLLYSSLPFILKRNILHLELPNQYNFSFNFYWALCIY
eukprot:Sdes_comp21839_c0_seq1m20393